MRYTELLEEVEDENQLSEDQSHSDQWMYQRQSGAADPNGQTVPRGD